MVGITGHRELRVEDLEALEMTVGAILDRLAAAYPQTPLMAMTALAEGADRILASAAIARGIPYLAPLPMPANSTRKTLRARACAISKPC